MISATLITELCRDPPHVNLLNVGEDSVDISCLTWPEENKTMFIIRGALLI